MKQQKNCQSCGMPLKYDKEKGGTELDGSKSLLYCSFCFQNGTFTQPNFTAQDMQNFCVDKMVELKYPRFIAKLFTKNIPKLERWK